MKKMIAFLSLSLCLILCLCSCETAKWKEYQTLFLSGSNDDASPNKEAEVDYSTDYFTKEKMSDRTLEWEGTVYTGSYHWSRNPETCSFVTDYYETEEGYEFGFKSGTSDLTCIRLTNKEFYDTEPFLDDIDDAPAATKQIADRYAVRYLGDLSAYTQQTRSFTNTKEKDGKIYEATIYSYTYVREVAGFPTSDLMEVRVTSKGHLAAIDMLDIGAFDEADIQIDKEKLNKSVTEKIDALYENSFYKVNSSEIQDQRLLLSPDGYYCVQSGVRLNVSNESEDYSTAIALLTMIRKK